MFRNEDVLLFGRDDDLHGLSQLLADGSVLLIGPRRIGKTELLRALPEYAEGSLRTVLVDLEGLDTVATSREPAMDG